MVFVDLYTESIKYDASLQSLKKTHKNWFISKEFVNFPSKSIVSIFYRQRKKLTWKLNIDQ